jgi:hypothetical protein
VALVEQEDGLSAVDVLLGRATIDPKEDVSRSQLAANVSLAEPHSAAGNPLHPEPLIAAEDVHLLLRNTRSPTRKLRVFIRRG